MTFLVCSTVFPFQADSSISMLGADEKPDVAYSDIGGMAFFLVMGSVPDPPGFVIIWSQGSVFYPFSHQTMKYLIKMY